MTYQQELAGKNVLVTGGAGFIGSHLVTRLLELGAQVRVLDDLSTGRRENLTAVASRIDFREGSLTHRGHVHSALEGIDYVLHEGAIPSVPRSIDDPATSHAANVDGTLTLLIEARHAGVKRLVYASSSSVYGNPETLPVRETFPTGPLSPYAVQKLAAENYCRVFYQVYGLETVSLRYFNVFGPGQNPKSVYAAVVPKFITAALEGRKIQVYGDGEQSRDFTYIENVVHANLLALVAPNAAGGVFNTACGHGITLNEILDAIRDISGRELDVEYLPPRTGDIRHSLADIRAAGEVLGYRPLKTVRQGLERTYDWFARRAGLHEPDEPIPVAGEGTADAGDPLALAG